MSLLFIKIRAEPAAAEGRQRSGYSEIIEGTGLSGEVVDGI
jgi:hypothetical protein